MVCGAGADSESPLSFPHPAPHKAGDLGAISGLMRTLTNTWYRVFLLFHPALREAGDDYPPLRPFFVLSGVRGWPSQAPSQRAAPFSSTPAMGRRRGGGKPTRRRLGKCIPNPSCLTPTRKTGARPCRKDCPPSSVPASTTRPGRPLCRLTNLHAIAGRARSTGITF